MEAETHRQREHAFYRKHILTQQWQIVALCWRSAATNVKASVLCVTIELASNTGSSREAIQMKNTNWITAGAAEVLNNVLLFISL